MSDFLQAERHPDADQLSAFVEHTLPAHEQKQTLAHLAHCPACRQIVQIVALSLPEEEALPVVRPEGVRANWFRGWRVAWGGVPLLAAVLVAVMLFHERSTPLNERARVERPAVSPQVPSVEPSVQLPPAPSLQSKQRVRPAVPSPPAIAGTLAEPPPAAAPGGVMGGVLGGIGMAPPQVPVPPTANAGPLGAFVASRGRFAPMVPAPLPSGLATISIASRGNQRLAIDTNHAVFFSEDEGRRWKAVPSQWEGRAVQVALTTTAPAADGVQAMARKTVPEGSAGAKAVPGLSGTVTDPSGGVIPGATVTAFRSGSSLVAVTDQQGRFEFKPLVGGRYRIEVEAPGFVKQSQAEEVLPEQPAVVHFTLLLAALSQTVTVEAGAPTSDMPIGDLSSNSQPFELTTDDGSRWISADGQSWTRK